MRCTRRGIKNTNVKYEGFLPAIRPNGRAQILIAFSPAALVPALARIFSRLFLPQTLLPPFSPLFRLAPFSHFAAPTRRSYRPDPLHISRPFVISMLKSAKARKSLTECLLFSIRETTSGIIAKHHSPSSLYFLSNNSHEILNHIFIFLPSCMYLAIFSTPNLVKHLTSS